MKTTTIQKQLDNADSNLGKAQADLTNAYELMKENGSDIRLQAGMELLYDTITAQRKSIEKTTTYLNKYFYK